MAFATVLHIRVSTSWTYGLLTLTCISHNNYLICRKGSLEIYIDVVDSMIVGLLHVYVTRTAIETVWVYIVRTLYLHERFCGSMCITMVTDVHPNDKLPWTIPRSSRCPH